MLRVSACALVSVAKLKPITDKKLSIMPALFQIVFLCTIPGAIGASVACEYSYRKRHSDRLSTAVIFLGFWAGYGAAYGAIWLLYNVIL